MGVNQYFYKEKGSGSFHDSRYAGIPNMHKYGLETSSKCNLCENEYGSYDCHGCYPWSTIKVTREDLPRITADMDVNETLFSDIMDEMGQDYFWFSEA